MHPDNTKLQHHKGRGACSNTVSRFVEFKREPHGESKEYEEDYAPTQLKTQVFIDSSRTIITKNNSPDVPFNRSINPYKGCEHGCSYCFARPTHAYLDLSPGLDFESKLFAKPDAAQLLTQELSKPEYKVEVIAIGATTDPYQPVERRLKITRSLLEVLNRFSHPAGIITKSSLIERDIEILSDMAQRNLVQVMISVTSLDATLSRTMEPRASAPHSRLASIEKLAKAGIPVGVLFAPVIPALNDCEMENLLKTCRDAGAQTAGYVMLRLPLEVKELFMQWMQTYYPLKIKHVVSLMKEMHGGAVYSSQWSVRQRGSGSYADMIAKRFTAICKKCGFGERGLPLDVSRFQRPGSLSHQLAMF